MARNLYFFNWEVQVIHKVTDSTIINYTYTHTVSTLQEDGETEQNIQEVRTKHRFFEIQLGYLKKVRETKVGHDQGCQILKSPNRDII